VYLIEVSISGLPVLYELIAIMCFANALKTIQYSSKGLLTLHSRTQSLPAVLKPVLHNLGIYKRVTTRRKYRKGRKTTQAIKIITGSWRPPRVCQRGVNVNNLVCSLVNPSVDRSHKLVKFGLWNARSINNKTAFVCEMIIRQQLDVLAVTETWLKGNSRDNDTLGKIKNCLKGHKLEHLPRASRCGGGVALLFRSSFSQMVHPTVPFKTFEHMDITLSHGSSSIRIIIIYRPQKLKMKNVPPFLDEFSTLLETISIIPGKVMIVGDINIHVDEVDCSLAKDFLDLLGATNFRNHVMVPTHKDGHTLDLLITRTEERVVSNINTRTDCPSDHYAVLCNLSVHRPPDAKCTVSHRPLRKINVDAFREDIISSELARDDAPEKYDAILKELLDKHAPLTTRHMTIRPHAPWFSDPSGTIRKAKLEKRRLERKWKQSNLEVHWQIYRQQCKTYNELIKEAQCEHYRDKVKSCDQHTLFKVIDDLTNPSKSLTLPSHEDKKDLANSFSNYFTSKIEKIRLDLSGPNTTMGVDEDQQVCPTSFSTFSAVTESEVSKLIKKAPNKSSSLDPIPTWLLKNCTDELVPSITEIINTSMSSGVVPTSFKTAMVTPLLKKSGLDPEALKNYRPVSNLSFLSKTLERTVAEQLQEYLTENNLIPRMQSAYRKHHSTETALLKVTNDVLIALDQRKEVVLVLLDLSAAFDTIDHQILLSRLQKRFGITDTVLKWFTSYLKDRCQQVSINGVQSNKVELLCGVPQGSVLGPILFTLYVSPLEDIIHRHNLKCMTYADDTQVYIEVRPGNTEDAKTQLQSCISEIRQWMSENMLKLNDDKTEIMHFTSKYQKSVPLQSVSVGTSNIVPSDHAKNIGVTMDCHMTMDKHVSRLCSSASLAIHSIGKIRCYLDQISTERLVHAYVTSRLDYCNSILLGLPTSTISRIQVLQNMAARLVTLTRKYEHITPVLYSLHWLPVKQRIEYKVLLLTYKALHQQAPSYITDLLSFYKPARQLRSASKAQLVPLTFRTKTYGARAFAAAAPRLWNDLPDPIRSSQSLNCFKQRLKTYLFNQAYL
jgi:hypothetical protein